MVDFYLILAVTLFILPSAGGLLLTYQSRALDQSLRFAAKKTRHCNRGKMGEGAAKVLNAERDHVQGEIEAPIKLLEYGDYECRFCAKARPIVRAIQRRLGDDVCFAFRHFPVTPAHPHAEPAAEAAEAANSQGKFWEMHEMLLQNQDVLNSKYLAACAAALGLDERRLMGEVTLEVYAMRIRDDFKLGIRAGVNRTPCFFINGCRYDGALALEPLLVAIAKRNRRQRAR